MEAACSSSSPSVLILHRSRPSAARRRPPATAHCPSASASTARLKASSSSAVDLSRGSAPSLTLFSPSSLRGYQRRLLRKNISAVFERFTERAIHAVVLSQREARALGELVVFNRHLLLGLIAEDRSSGGFLGSGITIDRAREVVRAGWTKGGGTEQTPPPSSTNVPFSNSIKRVFEAAVECSRSMAQNFIAPEHLVIGLLNGDDGSAALVLRSLGADLSELASVAFSRLQAEIAKDGREPLTSSRMMQYKPPSASSRSPNKTKDKSLISQFCMDLTARASEGLIDPVIGRDTEIQRIVQILCRRTKNNPILLGDAGVGKTAIAEGLALRIVNGEIPSFLALKRILSLDVGLLIAGAKERGELEARVTGLIREVRKSGLAYHVCLCFCSAINIINVLPNAGDIILFIDEVHTLIGTGVVGRGDKTSGLDIANLLKPSLGRGELQCIASTTLEEHRRHFDKDKALARRFQPVFISEPSQEDTVKILLGLREKYEIYHKCRFTLEAINAAVYLSARYIPDRHLPDKAIDLIDEAGSRARMEAFKRKKAEQIAVLSKSPEEYWQEIKAVQAMHEVVLENKLKYSTDHKLIEHSESEDDVKEIPLSISSSLNSDEQIIIGREDIAKVASLWSGIPVQQLNADDRKLLVGLDEELRKWVIGQDDAVGAISRAVKRSRVGLNDPNRPIAVMLFCGPTGVGKTELAKALAASYFGSKEAMLRLDMSEYMERHSVSKLIGSPPGYIGYGEGGTLTEAVRRKPFTVILLDEIEKAHPDVFNILLQVFGDGHLTDSQGRRVSFKNSLIVMTCNVGSEAISNGKRSIGFLLEEVKESNSYAGMKALMMEELKAYFLPELLNRIDEVVVFRSLEKAQMLEILNIMLKQVNERLEALEISLMVSDAIKDLVCQEGFDKRYGARHLRRAVTRLVEDVISEVILSGDFKPGDTLVLDVDATGNPIVSRPPNQTVQLSDGTSPL
ncbi:hypothetical protein Cni_G10519 [Canna indica]|uniref:Clp R domain-containing protein n=1 Tax=Canna indica TaxID=4628 RepID=A0AAQ3K7T9_9LILI|nr:hypothetical protein Cni_G10519 [Canna indica]